MAARSRSQWLQTRNAIVVLALLSCALHGRAFAQQKTTTPALPPAVLLNTAGAQAAGGAAIDPVIQTALEDLEVVNVVAKPGMDLGAVQLVIDCVAETPECLRAVTTQQSADVLIAPSLARTSGELVLSFLRFDARGKGEMKRVTHRQPGQTLTSATLDAVPDLLRELFELPPKPKAAPVVAATTPGAGAAEPLPEAPMEPPAANGGAPVGPILLGVGGALVIGTAAVLGATVNSARDDYDHLTLQQTKSPQDIDAAIAKKDSAKTRAVVTNVLWGVGGAALVGAAIWLAVDLSTRSDRAYVEDDNSSAKLSPLVGPHQLGLVWTQRGEGL